MSVYRRFILIALLILFPVSLHAEEGGVNTKALSLDECVLQALQTHPKISIYGQKMEQKKEKVKAITADNFPQVGAIASYDRLSYVTQSKKRSLGDSSDDYQADIVVTQPLFTGGKITAQKQSLRLGVDAAEQGYLAVKEDVIYGVKAAYFKLIFAHDIMRSKEDLLKYAELSYNTALDLHKRTKTPREETLLRLEVQLNEVKQDLINAQNSVMIAQKALLNSMGLDANGSIKVQDLKDDYFFAEDMPVDLVNNHELLKLSKELKEADEQIKIAKSDFYPQLSAHYRYGYEWGDWSQEGKTDWIAGVAVDLNIWDWGKTKADVRQAKAYKEELIEYEDLLKKQKNLELESALLRYESAMKRWKIARTSCGQARKSLNLFSQRYSDALVTSIELLDSQKAFSLAQINCALSKLDMRLAKAEIEKIKGKGYELK